MTRWIALGASLAGAGLVQAKETHNARLTMVEARAVALQKVPGKIVHEELEKEKGRWIYSIEVRPTGERGKRIKEVNLDADTGHVLEIGAETD